GRRPHRLRGEGRPRDPPRGRRAGREDRRAAAGGGRVSHRAGTILLAIGAGLALADGSIVVLALPDLLGELDTTVEGVAAVIGVYTAVLAVALPAAEWLRRRIGARRLG